MVWKLPPASLARNRYQSGAAPPPVTWAAQVTRVPTGAGPEGTDASDTSRVACAGTAAPPTVNARSRKRSGFRHRSRLLTEEVLFPLPCTLFAGFEKAAHSCPKDDREGRSGYTILPRPPQRG